MRSFFLLLWSTTLFLFPSNHHAFTPSSVIRAARHRQQAITTSLNLVNDQNNIFGRSTTTNSLLRLYSSFSSSPGGGDYDNNDDDQDDDTNNNKNNNNYYDDFGDFVIGDNDNENGGSSSSSSSSSTSLQERMNQVMKQEQQWQEQISQNWKLGQWSVRGCSLDPYSTTSLSSTSDDAKDDDYSEEKKIQISSLCALIPSTNSYDDEDDDDLDGNDNDNDIVLVGRTDGSICWLQLGGPNDYLATFTQQLVAKDVIDNTPPSSSSSSISDDGNNDNDDSLSSENGAGGGGGGMIISQELKREGQPQPTLSSSSSSSSNNPNTNIIGYDDNTPNVNYNKKSFEILAQLPNAGNGGPIRNMKIIHDVLYYIDDSQPNLIFQLSNSVSSFLQQQQDQQQQQQMKASSSSSSSSLPLDRIHTSPIISLLTHKGTSSTNTNTNIPVLISTSDNGQVVFWKQQQSTTATDDDTTVTMMVEPFHQLQIPFQNGNDNDVVLLSCDIDSDYLYFGDSNGMLYVYDSSTLLLQQQEQQQQQPIQIFQAFSNDSGISALCAAGESSMGTGGRVLSTRTIIAGSTRGEIKQWELIPRGSIGAAAGVEFWPRLASQTIPGKAHIFDSTVSPSSSSEQGGGGGGGAGGYAILSLRVIEKDNVILSTNADEIKFWDPKSGKLHFDMQGLEFGSLPNYGYGGVALICLCP